MTTTHDSTVRSNPQETLDDRHLSNGAVPSLLLDDDNSVPPAPRHHHVFGWLFAGLAIAATVALVVLLVSTDRTATRTEQSPVGDAKDHPNYGPVVGAGAAVGDAKDHPNFGPVVADVDAPVRRRQGSSRTTDCLPPRATRCRSRRR